MPLNGVMESPRYQEQSAARIRILENAAGNEGTQVHHCLPLVSCQPHAELLHNLSYRVSYGHTGGRPTCTAEVCQGCKALRIH